MTQLAQLGPTLRTEFRSHAKKASLWGGRGALGQTRRQTQCGDPKGKRFYLLGVAGEGPEKTNTGGALSESQLRLNPAQARAHVPATKREGERGERVGKRRRNRGLLVAKQLGFPPVLVDKREQIVALAPDDLPRFKSGNLAVGARN